MQLGISTASLFTRFNTEDAIKFLNQNGVKTAEVFLESYCEYNKKFGKLVNKNRGDTKVHSIHTLTTQFEPQLYSVNERAKADSFNLLKGTAQAAKEMGAKYYTFHGTARLKKNSAPLDHDRVGKITQEIIDTIAPYGLTLAYENVHWCNYNYLGFFEEMRKRTTGLKATLDIKQARSSNLSPFDLIKEMGSDIVTVHLSDILDNGKMCLPGKGITDFEQLFRALYDKGFNGAMLIEAYSGDYGKNEELFESLDYISNLAEKIFK
ncbi:MAG: sugar phosphate isomerase/epimerase [Clostridia bacterium]|nr:sugar phosphate isomerase/epimerase [Clostridia bacterium]